MAVVALVGVNAYTFVNKADAPVAAPVTLFGWGNSVGPTAPAVAPLAEPKLEVTIAVPTPEPAAVTPPPVKPVIIAKVIKKPTVKAKAKAKAKSKRVKLESKLTTPADIANIIKVKAIKLDAWHRKSATLSTARFTTDLNVEGVPPPASLTLWQADAIDRQPAIFLIGA